MSLKEKIVKVNTDPEGNGYVDLKEFEDLIDISQVFYYSLKKLDNGSIAVKFYDENKNELFTKDMIK